MPENKNGSEIEMTYNNEETASNTDTVSPNGFLPYALSQEIVRALELLGDHEPTEIQREVIPAVLEGKNVVARSRTMTGASISNGISSWKMSVFRSVKRLSGKRICLRRWFWSPAENWRSR